jgi:diaminopimelate epimerase
LIDFVKYHGTGNDFILIDARDPDFPFKAFTQELVSKWCDRHFGVGADGLILIRTVDGFDFHMDYFNSDGLRSSMCGNGSRCAMHFARDLGIIENHADFMAPDGPHEAHFEGDKIAVKMNVGRAELMPEGDWKADTGSPHFVRFVGDLDGLDVDSEGRGIRRSPPYQKEGINVNFVEEADTGIKVRTYERGVEGETLSCGTGVTACALVYMARDNDVSGRVQVDTRGGRLEVDIGELGVWLIGPAEPVFTGHIEIS